MEHATESTSCPVMAFCVHQALGQLPVAELPGLQGQVHTLETRHQMAEVDDE